MSKKILLFIKKEKKSSNIFSVNHSIMIISLIIGILVVALVGAYSNKTQSNIANNLLRLHILANSDSEFDQALKLKVRDAIIKEMTPKFDKSIDINQTRKIAFSNIDNMKKVAKDIVNENGMSYDVKVEIGNSYFPTKHYGDMVFPPGIYEAVKVEIGEAKGHNWWCVLFPPLCFVDATNGYVPSESKAMLENTLSPEEYTLLTSSSEGEIPVKIKFKSVEIWESSKQKVEVAISKLF